MPCATVTRRRGAMWRAGRGHFAVVKAPPIARRSSPATVQGPAAPTRAVGNPLHLHWGAKLAFCSLAPRSLPLLLARPALTTALSVLAPRPAAFRVPFCQPFSSERGAPLRRCHPARWSAGGSTTTSGTCCRPPSRPPRWPKSAAVRRRRWPTPASAFCRVSLMPHLLGQVVVAGQRQRGLHLQGGSLRVPRRANGSFRRVVRLPPLAPDAVGRLHV